MQYMKATVNLRLRKNPGLSAETLGEIARGSVCYVVGETRNWDGLTWINIVAPTLSGSWFDGWSATSLDGEPFLTEFFPEQRIASPIMQRFPITQLFAENPPTYAHLGYMGHNGLDFGTPVGTPVMAVAPGVVAHARSDPRGYGNYVRIDHAWGISICAHLDRINVIEGQTVQMWQQLGVSGNTGWSDGPHLHFEIRLYPIDEGNGFGGRVDPLPYIDRRFSFFKLYVPASLRRELENEQH